jgi:ammonium transporter, Amt family
LLIQAGAALTVIVWDGLVTFAILKVISLFTSLREADSVLEVGDLAVHGEVAYAPEELPSAGASLTGHQDQNRTDARENAEAEMAAD